MVVLFRGLRFYGLYKGFRFRSLLEYSYMKHLESEGLDLVTGVDYESFRIPYRIGKGKSRIYIPDFHLHEKKLVVELKYEAHIPRKKNRAKIEAAKLFFIGSGLKYIVLTEKDFPIFKMKDAVKDTDIQWPPKLKSRFIKKRK